MIFRNISGIKHPIALRPGTTDVDVFSQVFEQKEYEIPVRFTPNLIIDGGANVGYASIWFANKFPEARILAYEIEETNFEMLQKNLVHYPNVVPFRMALWSKSTFLEVARSKFEWSGNWDFVCRETAGSHSGKNLVRSVSLADVLSDSEFGEIDILKLDIEGAEREIFSENYRDWLPRVKLIIIELHDRYSPGSSAAFYSAINDYDYVQSRKGENLVFHRRDVC